MHRRTVSSKTPVRLSLLTAVLLAVALGACSEGSPATSDGGPDTTSGGDATTLAPDATPPLADGALPADAGAGVYRPFSAESPWNARIPSEVAVRPDSDALVAHLRASSEWPGLGVSRAEWSVPVYRVDGTVPLVDVRTPLSNEGEAITFRWPVPAGAAPASASDGHMTLVDEAGGRGYDFYQAVRRDDGSWDCSLCATVDLRGAGVRPPKGGSTPWYESHGSRACGFPLLAGLITVDELRAGRIEHALVIAYPGLRQRWFRSPASTGHPANGLIREDQGIPCGGRVQLDPAVDVDALELSPAGRTIARALQEYGAYVGDFSGSINLYAESSAEAREAFRGLLETGTTQGIDLGRLRVLEWGELYPDG